VAFEKNHIGWAMWDYQTNFGVVTKSNGVTTPDVDVLNALGLHAPSLLKNVKLSSSLASAHLFL
jgi:hypothetical protein